MTFRKTVVVGTLSTLLGLGAFAGVGALSTALAGDWGNNFGASSMTNYLNEWNSIQGSLMELNQGAATYGDSYYNDTLNTRNYLNNRSNELYNSTKFWNN
jgi:hypothetical protein